MISSVSQLQLSEHLRFYQELGVTGISRDPKWRERASPGGSSPGTRDPNPDVPGPESTRHESADQSPDTVIPVALARSAVEALSAIRDDIGDCTRCKLHTQGRTQVVFGVGNHAAELMFV